MYVVSYSFSYPRVHRVPDGFQPGYADVPFDSARDLASNVARMEMIDVLRTYDGHAASRFADMTRYLNRHAEARRLGDAYEFAYEFLQNHAEDFVLYRQTQTEEGVTMTQPTPQTQPAKNGGAKTATSAPAKDAKAPKEKKAPVPREKKYPTGATGASKISFGADKSGKKYGVDNNPKKGAAATRFAKYKEGMTVEEALKAGVQIGDLRWDSDPKRGFIKLG